MINSSQWDKLTYKRPFLKDDRPKISRLAGIDSEAYKDGKPFMFCTYPQKDIISPKNFIDTVFSEKYKYTNFLVWNLKYDSGAFLFFVNENALKYLWKNHTLIYEHKKYTFKIKYIPHKLLRIQHKDHTISFWDIAQFYHSSLDKAAKDYLNKRKKDITTKNFTRKYVNRFYKSIAKYCLHDARLTYELGVYFVDKLEEFGITATNLYSCASISFKYFCEHSRIVTSWDWWKYDQTLLKLASDAYEGGKFEVTSRGSFYGYEFDITSAYPYEIANLIDITDADIIHSPEYHRNATYGFLTVRISNPEGKYLPCGVKRGHLRIYPAGEYTITITKEEYEYLLSINIQPHIEKGVWLHVHKKRYPYRKVIKDLFTIKAKYKNSDAMIYMASKIIMNSFYGKCVQCVEQPDGSIQAGPGWNPIYGAVITANTRIKVTRIQNILQDKCLAVHTDSVITTEPIPDRFLKPGIGNFEAVTEGESIIIACGMYQVGNQCAFKGFVPKNNDSWKSLLNKFKNRKTIPSSCIRVESWVEAMAKNHGLESINVFSRMPKRIDLNCDTKRVWMRTVKARDLLSSLETSIPKIYVETI